MKIRLYATLRQMAGAPAVEVAASSGDTVGVAISQLVAEHPALRDYMLDDKGGLQDHIQVFLGGRHIRWLDGLDTVIAEGDELFIFPPVGGGQCVVNVRS